MVWIFTIQFGLLSGHLASLLNTYYPDPGTGRVVDDGMRSCGFSVLVIGLSAQHELSLKLFFMEDKAHVASISSETLNVSGAVNIKIARQLIVIEG